MSGKGEDSESSAKTAGLFRKSGNLSIRKRIRESKDDEKRQLISKDDSEPKETLNSSIQLENEEDEEEEFSLAILKKKVSTKSLLKKDNYGTPTNASDDDDDSFKIERREKKIKRGIVSNSNDSKGRSGSELMSDSRNDVFIVSHQVDKNSATRISALYDDDDDYTHKKNKVLSGKDALKTNEDYRSDEDDDELIKGNKKTYKGLSSYNEFVNKKDSAPTQKSAGSSIRAGQLKAASNVRITSQFDYEQDICKDYQRTGYCGYGDTCIYIHDRTVYKPGSKVENSWKKQQKKIDSDISKRFKI